MFGYSDNDFAYIRLIDPILIVEEHKITNVLMFFV
jgi:hypothetical protein